jgi:hypothetical protein
MPIQADAQLPTSPKSDGLGAFSRGTGQTSAHRASEALDAKALRCQKIYSQSREETQSPEQRELPSPPLLMVQGRQ